MNEYNEVDELINKLTAQDIIEAMRKNGYEQTRNGNYFQYEYQDKNAKLRACAYGQAALNLIESRDDNLLEYAARNIHSHAGRLSAVFSDVVHMNDYQGMSCQEIADRVEATIKARKEDV